MPESEQEYQRFGEIAVSMALVSRQKLQRALLVQKCIFSRTQVNMPLGKIFKEMGLMTQEQIDEVLEAQKALVDDAADSEKNKQTAKTKPKKDTLTGIHLTISSDKLSAYISPTEVEPQGLTLEAVKTYLAENGVVYGLIEDKALSEYLVQSPLPDEPFKVAGGLPHVPARPPEVIFHFDTDPMRIGTLLDDGTMDWKNRGKIPQVEAGDILVEKTEGDPGRPGMSVGGKEIPPPRIREPQLKSAKGAQRSEDGRQIVAKIQGTPKLSPDGKVSVFGMLPVKGDIGVETGNIEFEGFIETSGGVTAGYSVKGKALRTAEIQDATVEITGDVNCYGGIYGTTLKVGGDLKASHLQNSRIELGGDLVVEKEIIGCTIETGARCLIIEGKILDSKIDAKKGVQAKDVGAEAAKPSELLVGHDREYERGIAALKKETAVLGEQKKEAEAALSRMSPLVDTITGQLSRLAREQESYIAQKRQFEEQLQGEGPNAVKDEEEVLMLTELISELDEKNAAFEKEARELKEQESEIRIQLADCKERIGSAESELAACKAQFTALEEAHKADPGSAVVKVSGALHARTKIVGPSKEITIPKTMQNVRVAEVEVDGSAKRQIKISNLV